MLISFLKIACSVNFLVDRGGDSFVRSEVRVFTLFFGSETFFRIYLAFDYTFPPQAEGKVISKLGLLVYFSYQIKVRCRFSLCL